MRVKRLGSFAVLVCMASMPAGAAQARQILNNGPLRAEFAGGRLRALVDLQSGFRMALADEDFAVTVGGRRIEGRNLPAARIQSDRERLTLSYTDPAYKIQIVYELRPGWRFLSKQITLEPMAPGGYRVNEIEALSARLTPSAQDELPLANGKTMNFGNLLRFTNGTGASGKQAAGAFFWYQNPFNAWKKTGQAFAASYAPEMDWQPTYGPFKSDRLCIGLYALSGHRFPARAVPEWTFVADYSKYLAENPLIDMAEADALVECVRTFLIYRPNRSIRVHVPWCENDYQIDVATADGWAEYQRIIDQAAAVGCQYTFFTPANSELSSLKENRDAWGWENLLFFGMGQKIRKGEWDPARDPVPESLRRKLDYARSKNIKLISYSYPSLPFLQDPEWTRWAGPKVGGYNAADTGLRSFQDWWVGKLVDFVKATGAGGYSFDHWWIAYDNASSKYAQWYGCRRILETLRERVPDILIDGRQQYMNFGPWTWLAGSYPHPTLTDEQPESFAAFPDLHTDRVSADRQRFAAWVYRMQRFAPPEILPGYMTHQTERSDAGKVMRRDRFRPRDWDLLGWRYSVLSSIATAPFNHVVDYLPARDTDEFKALSDEDKRWMRGWMDWTDRNIEILRRVKPILGQPMIGRVDGTAACAGGRGFVFLFNPNYRPLDAGFALDASIGWSGGNDLVLEELYPQPGRRIAHPHRRHWKPGDRVSLPLPGTQAMVVEIKPAEARHDQPELLNARGTARQNGRRLELSEVPGEPGTEKELVVWMPGSARIESLTVNGKSVAFQQERDRVNARVSFSGRAFGQNQPLWKYDPSFAGGTIKAAVTIPARIFEQLRRRQQGWPVPYTEDDLLAPWLGSHRLLLFAQLAEPDDSMALDMTIDGKAVPLRKAYNSIYGHSPKRTFLGYYADVSFLEPDREHQIEVILPKLAPGRFQGLFFENIEPEYTREIR